MDQKNEANVLESAIDWIRRGYPQGVPAHDFPPLLALLTEALGPDEASAVVERGRPVEPSADADRSTADGHVEVTDLREVAARLAGAGWPLQVLDGPLPDAVAARTERESVLQRVINWLRQGYPAGVPSDDVAPILAVLHRRLTDEQVQQVAQALLRDRRAVGTAVTDESVDEEITRVTGDAPAPEDVNRVRAILARQGWPLQGGTGTHTPERRPNLYLVR